MSNQLKNSRGLPIMRINTNISSMRSQEYLRQNQIQMDKAMNRLSSGKRINSASDDAAGLAIATRMRAKESALNVGSRNTQDGMSLVQTAESALGSISNILIRMKDLATQSASDTNNTSDRTSLNKEFAALQDEIKHISDNTNFNGTKLLDNTATLKIQLSDTGSDTLDIDLSSIQTTLTTLNLEKSATPGTPGATEADITTQGAANTAITSLNTAIDQVAGYRAELGATLNRLDYNVQNVNNQATAMASSASQIEDADMAKEMSEMTKFKILSEAGISMLSQANQTPQAVSKLLQ